MTGGLLALALFAPTAPPDGGLQKGDELTFTGTVEEAIERPGNRFRRTQKLEVRVLVLEKRESWVDVAVLTLLRRSEDAVAGAVGTVTGGTPEQAAPPGTRLDLLRIHADGSAHHLNPVGPPPLIFDDKTPARTLPPLPLDSFAPFEFGMFPPRPPRSVSDKPWAVASTDLNRPAEMWQVKGTDTVTAECCSLLWVNQQHPNWEKPVGGTTAWHRAEAVSVSTLDGTARKVYRVIQQRDGLAADVAAWVEVKYELKDKTRVIGRTFDRYRRDVETAFVMRADVAPFLASAVKHGPKFFETRLLKLNAYLNESDVSSPYREALLAVRRQLEAASRGESVAVGLVTVPRNRNAWPAPGQAAADFTAGTFRLSENRGKPVLLVFFKPGSETTDLALAIADALHQKYGNRAAIVPLAVFGDGKNHRKRTVPIYDGTQAETAYGVESVPRFVFIDGAGVVQWTFTGVGAETGYSAHEQLTRQLAPASPNAPTGTNRAPGTGNSVALPRP